MTESVPLDTWPEIGKGDLLGWFNMGSTVIVLLPRGAADWDAALEPGMSLVMGQSIGSLTRADT
jgi:phosphatidylserine decarboxylase